MVIGLHRYPGVSMVMGERRQEARGPASRGYDSPHDSPDGAEHAPERDRAQPLSPRVA
jgi:hypothetical protein